MDSLRGRFLIASRHLPDVNFSRAVVLMIQDDADGALGVIVNRPMKSTVGDVWDLVVDLECDCQDPIHVGGPVQGPLLALHTEADLSETEILPGLFLATEKERLNQLVQSSGTFRIFSGYSGWDSGQLADEMKAGGWLTAPANEELVFSNPEELWKRVTESIGLEVLSSTVGKRAVVANPLLN